MLLGCVHPILDLNESFFPMKADKTPASGFPKSKSPGRILRNAIPVA